ncbi:MAG: hypothetical protein ACK5OX_04350 [Desertimonas sp.]
MSSTRFPRAILVVAAAVVSLAACADDDNDGEASTAPTADTASESPATTNESPESTAPDATSDPASTETSTSTGESTGGDADREDYVAAGLAQLGTDDAAAECVVNAVIDSFGLDTIEATATPEEFWSAASPLAESGFTADSPEVDETAEAIASCDGIFEAFAAAAGQTVSDESFQCMYDEGAQQVLGQVSALSLVGADTSELEAEGRTINETCGIGG